MTDVKIGMNMLLWGARTQVSHIPVFEGLATAGFDGVEISVAGQSVPDLKTLRAAVSNLGMSLTACTIIPSEANPVSPDASVRASALDYLKARIDEAACLGSDILVGGVSQAHRYFSGAACTDQEWEWSRAYLLAAGHYASSCGIGLGLEFLNRFEGYLVNTAASATRMCKDIGLDNVGVLYDTHHANIEDPNPAIALPSCSDHLMHVHLSESHRGTLGTGQVKWEETFATLKFLEYRGWLTVEALGISDEVIVARDNVWRNAFDSPEQLYTDSIEFVRQGLAN